MIACPITIDIFGRVGLFQPVETPGPVLDLPPMKQPKEC